MEKVRVLPAEDHTIVAEDLKGLLKDEVERVHTVGDGRALLQAAKQVNPT
jgi:CheY-like chemotaxis protein